MLNTELEKIPRTDDRYLKLLTEEHTIIKEEKSLSDEVCFVPVTDKSHLITLCSTYQFGILQ